MRKVTHKLALFSLLVIGSILIVGCSGGGVQWTRFAQDSVLPDFLADAPARVREAYRFAYANKDELSKIPCYCGCNFMGHIDNYTCYIKSRSAEGVEWDAHAEYCQICVDITHDVIDKLAAGESMKSIREYIDSTYSGFGTGTDTMPVK
jgi:hypothetical protein